MIKVTTENLHMVYIALCSIMPTATPQEKMAILVNLSRLLEVEAKTPVATLTFSYREEKPTTAPATPLPKSQFKQHSHA